MFRRPGNTSRYTQYNAIQYNQQATQYSILQYIARHRLLPCALDTAAIEVSNYVGLCSTYTYWNIIHATQYVAILACTKRYSFHHPQRCTTLHQTTLLLHVVVFLSLDRIWTTRRCCTSMLRTEDRRWRRSWTSSRLSTNRCYAIVIQLRFIVRNDV